MRLTIQKYEYITKKPPILQLDKHYGFNKLFFITRGLKLKAQ